MTPYYEYLQKIYAQNEANNSYALLNEVELPTLSLTIEEAEIVKFVFWQLEIFSKVEHEAVAGGLYEKEIKVFEKIRKFLAENA